MRRILFASWLTSLVEIGVRIRREAAEPEGGQNLGSNWGQTGVQMGSNWGLTVVKLGSNWGSIGVKLGSNWGRTGDVKAVVSISRASSYASPMFTCQHVLHSYALLGPILRERRLHRTFSHHGFATRHLVPTRIPVLFLTRVAAVPGGLALRANLEVLQKALNQAPFVAAILAPLQRFCAQLVKPLVDWVKPRRRRPGPYTRPLLSST
jgi:hypothetical protein